MKRLAYVLVALLFVLVALQPRIYAARNGGVVFTTIDCGIEVYGVPGGFCHVDD